MMGGDKKLIDMIFLIFHFACATGYVIAIADYDGETVLPKAGKTKAVKGGSPMRLKYPRHLTGGAGGAGDVIPADLDVPINDAVEETLPGASDGDGETDKVLDYNDDYNDDYYEDYYEDYYDDYYYYKYGDGGRYYDDFDGDRYYSPKVDFIHYDVSGEGVMKNNNMGTGMRERCKDCKDTITFATNVKGGHLLSRCRMRCRSRVNRQGYSFKVFNKCPRLCTLAYKTKSNGMFTKNPCEEVGYC